MSRKTVFYALGILVILSIIFSSVISSSFWFSRQKIIRVAIIRQTWDPLDMIPSGKALDDVHKICLKEGEKHYNVKFEVYNFWDSWQGGDVQNGWLIKKKIDVLVAPGGFGGWYTPKKYREEIKKFVFLGGGFYGICGDSTFGALGFKHFNNRYIKLVNRLLGFEALSPMLGLANVYTDASDLLEIIGMPIFFTKLDVIRALTALSLSRAPILMLPTDPPIQKPYFNKKIKVMLGNAPMIDGRLINRLYMPKVITIAILKGYDKPYHRSIEGKKAIIATTYGRGRVVLSAVHPELTTFNNKAHDIYVRNVLWLANALPLKNKKREEVFLAECEAAPHCCDKQGSPYVYVPADKKC